MKQKIILIFGTRPEAIKMGPIYLELKNNANFDVKVIVTGQHRQMLDQVLEVFKIIPDYDLSIMKKNQDLFDITINVMEGIKKILEMEKPDLVLVHGDTSTTFAAGLSCFYLGIKLAHVEAGLRTYNIKSPFPEEFNRRSISLIADYNFAPTEISKRNLLVENVPDKKIFVTGNTAIDALKITAKENYHSTLFDNWLQENDRLILLTAHRRENLGKPMREMFEAIHKIIKEFPDVKVVYPIHKNPIIRELAKEVFNNDKNLKIVEPLDVVSFHNLMAKSYLILTDSGGIQEEAPSLGVPVLVMRDTTERPEGIEAGTLKLVGTSFNTIYTAFKTLLVNKKQYNLMSNAINPYGDGFAAKRIVEILERELNK